MSRETATMRLGSSASFSLTRETARSGNKINIDVNCSRIFVVFPVVKVETDIEN